MENGRLCTGLPAWLLAGLVLLQPSLAGAQSIAPDSDPPPAATAENPSDAHTESVAGPARHPLLPAREEGFVAQSTDGRYQFTLGTLLRGDGRFDAEQPSSVTDHLLVRLVRLNAHGHIGRFIDIFVAPQYSNNAWSVSDAYVEIQASKAFMVRAGKYTAPVGHEAALNDANTLFMERGVTVNLMPSREIGLMARGELKGGIITYRGGVFAGVVDGTSSNTSTDTSHAKELAGRLTVSPFVTHDASPLAGLTIGFGASRGAQKDGLPFYRTSIQQRYFSYDQTAAADGLRTRISPQAYYYHKSFGGFSELVRSRQEISRGQTHAAVANRAWQVAGAWLLTGEQAGERVKPRRPFDPEAGGWGAWQVMGRYGVVDANEAVALGFADANASPHAHAVGIGLMWFLTMNLKTVVNVERTAFSGNPDAPRPVEHALLMRLQVNY